MTLFAVSMMSERMLDYTPQMSLKQGRQELREMQNLQTG